MINESTKSQRLRGFLLSLLADLTGDRKYKRCFKAAHQELHYFFWNLKKNESFKYFVEDLLFDTNGNFPHSEQIDELLQEFQLSGILSRPNPTYRYNDITITESPSAEEFKKNLSADMKKAYPEILEQFKKELGVRESE
jgi:hypothetical protein